MRSVYCPLCSVNINDIVKAAVRTELERIMKKNAARGGDARAARLTPERRREIARLGGIAKRAKARHGDHNEM